MTDPAPPADDDTCHRTFPAPPDLHCQAPTHPEASACSAVGNNGEWHWSAFWWRRADPHA